MREVGQEVAQKKHTQKQAWDNYLGLGEVKGIGRKFMLKSNIGKIWSPF